MAYVGLVNERDLGVALLPALISDIIARMGLDLGKQLLSRLDTRTRDKTK